MVGINRVVSKYCDIPLNWKSTHSLMQKCIFIHFAKQKKHSLKNIAQFTGTTVTEIEWIYAKFNEMFFEYRLFQLIFHDVDNDINNK